MHQYEKSSRKFTAQALVLAFKVYEKQEKKHIAKKYGTMLVSMFPKSVQASQYILNELYQTEADKQAKEYQKFVENKVNKQSTKKKRFILLSPKNTEENDIN